MTPVSDGITGGTRPGESRTPSKPPCPHRTGRAPVEDADRRTCDRHVRKRRSAFLSTTAERDDHCVGGTKDAANLSQPNKARKPIDIAQSFGFTHPSIVTRFRRQEKWTSARKTERFLPLKGGKLRTRFHDEPKGNPQGQVGRSSAQSIVKNRVSCPWLSAKAFEKPETGPDPAKPLWVSGRQWASRGSVARSRELHPEGRAPALSTLPGSDGRGQRPGGRRRARRRC